MAKFIELKSDGKDILINSDYETVKSLIIKYT